MIKFRLRRDPMPDTEYLVDRYGYRSDSIVSCMNHLMRLRILGEDIDKGLPVRHFTLEELVAEIKMDPQRVLESLSMLVMHDLVFMTNDASEASNEN